MNSSLEIFGLAGMLGVLYLLSKSKSAQAAPATTPFAARMSFPPLGVPITRANVVPTAVPPMYLDSRTPGFTLDPNLGTGIVKLSDAPYYLNRNTPAYPVAANDLPPAQQPAWFNPNNAIWQVTP